MSVVPIYALPFHIVFLIFIIFSVVGWISEVLYVGIFFEHKFVNRGFLHGPICPIYGFGGLSILLLPQSLYSTWVMLFFASMLFGTIVEYISSWILEKLFHTRWWDYSHYKFNIRGRVDLLITVRRLVDFSVTMEKVRVLREKYGAYFLQKIEQVQPKLRNVESFMHRFPMLKSINYKEEFELLKERIKIKKSEVLKKIRRSQKKIIGYKNNPFMKKCDEEESGNKNTSVGVNRI